VVAAAGGRLLHGVPARFTVGGGLLLIGAGQFCMAFLDAGSTSTALVAGLVLVGVGTGLVAPSVAGAALATVERERSGMASGAVNAFRQFGYALGLAFFGTVLTSRMADSLPRDTAHALAGGGAGALRGTFPEHALRAAFASGLNTAAVAAGLVAVTGGALVLALLRTPGEAREGVTDPGATTLTEETATQRN
ncbi:MAG: MFS transporter, partial [Streptomyces sp.]|nr:MFS transporter [Streptomyces sp.]